MQRDRLVTTIITSYNKGPYLAEAIQSALSQQPVPQEVLVIDDGSNDNTRDVASSFGDAVRYFYQDNHGQSNARNRGIALASGEYVAFLDGDDRWFEGKLAKQVELLDGHPDVAVVYSRKVAFRHGTERPRCKAAPRSGLFRGQILDHLLADNFVPLSSTLVRRSCLLELGGFDESLRVAEDLELWLRIARNHSFDYVDEALVEYRIGIDQIGARVPDQLTPAVDIIRRFVDRFYGGCYPRPSVIRMAMAARYSAHGDSLLGGGKRASAIAAHVRSISYEPFTLSRYTALGRSALPHSLVKAFKRVARSRTSVAL